MIFPIPIKNRHPRTEMATIIVFTPYFLPIFFKSFSSNASGAFNDILW